MSVTPEHIHQSNLIEDIDDPLADAVGLGAWAWLNAQDQVDPFVIQTTHLIATATQRDLDWQQRGKWRRAGVQVGGRVAPGWLLVPNLILDWCEDLRTAVVTALALGEVQEQHSPRALHVAFEKIHPFIDGNGRTGRLLMWWHEERIGRQPTLLTAEDRWLYYDWFRE